MVFESRFTCILNFVKSWKLLVSSRVNVLKILLCSDSLLWNVVSSLKIIFFMDTLFAVIANLHIPKPRYSSNFLYSRPTYHARSDAFFVHSLGLCLYLKESKFFGLLLCLEISLLK